MFLKGKYLIHLIHLIELNKINELNELNELNIKLFLELGLGKDPK